MLRNTLKSLLDEEILKSDSFYEQRPEKLGIPDFVELTKKVEAARKETEE